MEWRKHWAKQRIEWDREDIKWSEGMEKTWRKHLAKHIKKHDNKWREDCKICRLWKEIIENEKASRANSKKEIREILRGER